MILLTGYSGFIGSNFEDRCDFQPIDLRNPGNPLKGFENQKINIVVFVVFLENRQKKELFGFRGMEIQSKI